MASTAIQICNLALARIGVKDFIESLAEQTTEGLACNSLYSTSRDQALSSLPWPFATKRGTLALLALESDRAGWEYVYALPADCLSPRHIWTGSRTPGSADRIPYAIELNDAGNDRVLLTDKEDAELVYTCAVTNPLLFPPLFVDALAWLLASELSMPLAIRTDLRTNAQQMWLAMQTRASAIALQEGHELPPTTPTLASRE